MNRRVLLGSFLALVCLATLWGVWSQRSQVAGLRAERQHLLAQRAARADGAASLARTDAVAAGSGTGAPALAVTPELLRLRSEVTRLSERRRELVVVRAENERLRAQLARRGTNGAGGFQLPPGYLRKTEARPVGYNTPEDTLQSLLWAFRNRDMTNILRAFTPGQAESLRASVCDSRQSMDSFFADSKGIVGLRVLKREQNANDGSIALELEVFPGMPGRPLTFRQINGQWKIDDPL